MVVHPIQPFTKLKKALYAEIKRNLQHDMARWPININSSHFNSGRKRIPLMAKHCQFYGPVLDSHITEAKFNHQKSGRWRGGHFCHCDGKSINLQLTRGVPLVGQLSLYLLNDFNSLLA